MGHLLNFEPLCFTVTVSKPVLFISANGLCRVLSKRIIWVPKQFGSKWDPELTGISFGPKLYVYAA